MNDVNDLISRQAAIDAIGEEPLVWYDGEDEIAERNQWERDIEAIKQLPSAQPGIIRCKDCKHYWIHKCMDSMPMEICDLEQTFYDAEHDFCSLAERREVTT